MTTRRHIPSTTARRLPVDALYCLLVVAVLAALAARGAATSGYNWQWERVWPFFFSRTDKGLAFGPLIATGLVCTLRISALALMPALCCGLAAAVLRLSGGPLSRGLAVGYVQLMRNTPLMVQIFALYTLVPASWGISAEGIAVIALGLFEGAYMAEIFRAGILAVPQNQWEAAQSLGLPARLCWLHVVLPQALRHSLPPLVSQSVCLVKDSSLAGIIAVGELAQQSGLVVSDTFLSFEVWLPVAGIYLVLALILSVAAAGLEGRLSRGMRPESRTAGV